MKSMINDEFFLQHNLSQFLSEDSIQYLYNFNRCVTAVFFAD